MPNKYPLVPILKQIQKISPMAKTCWLNNTEDLILDWYSKKWTVNLSGNKWTQRAVIGILKLGRGEKSGSGMEAFRVVKDLNPFNNRCFCHRPAEKGRGVNELSLEGSKKSFGNRIIPAISPPTHPRSHVSVGQCLLIGLTGLLGTPVRVK